MTWELVDLPAPGADETWLTQLAEAAATPNPCFEAGYLRAAMHLPEMRAMRLLRIEEGGEPVAVLPLAPSSRFGPIPVPSGFRAAWSDTFLGQPLILPGHEVATADAIVGCLEQSKRTWLRLQALDAHSPLATRLAEHRANHRVSMAIERWSRGYVERRDAGDYLDARPHANLKRLRRQRRVHERNAGCEVTVNDRRADATALDTFLRIEAGGWKGRVGVANAARPGRSAFLHDLVDWFRQRDRLRLWSLECAGVVLAMKLNLIAGDTVFCYLITFDESAGRLSPGLQLEVENFRLFHAERAAMKMDSCASENNQFANRLYPARRDLVTLHLGVGLAGATITGLLPIGKRLAERAQRVGRTR